MFISFVWGVFVRGVFGKGGFCPGGFCPGVYVRGVFVLIPRKVEPGSAAMLSFFIQAEKARCCIKHEQGVTISKTLASICYAIHGLERTRCSKLDEAFCCLTWFNSIC